MNNTAVAKRPPWSADPLPAQAPVRSQDGLPVSEEDYWRDYYLDSDTRYEWNNGRLEEKPVSDYETFLVYDWFMELLRNFLRARPIARLVALEMGFRLRLPDGVVIRRPDVGVVRNDNPQPLLPLDRSYRGIFDLCVEALSDGERRDLERDTLQKKAEYAAGGVPEYFILHREPAHQAFYTLTAAGLYVPIPPQAGVMRSRVLPGLQLRLEHLCTRPAPADLRHDPVYADFLFPGWQEAEARADAAAAARAGLEARLREESQARAAAEAALARAEAELARLRFDQGRGTV